MAAPLRSTPETAITRIPIAVTSTLNANVLSSAISTSGGAENDGTSNSSEDRLADPNDDGNTTDRAQTDTSGGSNIDFAGAVSVTIYRPTTEAVISTSSNLTTDGSVMLSASSTDTVSTLADGSSTASSGTGVGVAVALGFELPTVRASLEGGNFTASTVSVSAMMDADNTFKVEAKSGGGDGADFQFAGSLAIHVLTTTVEAVVDGSVNLNGADLTLTANSMTSAITNAIPNKVPVAAADKGVGISVALYIGTNTTKAAILDGTQASNVGTLTLSATGNHKDDTKAEAGGAGDGSFTLGGAIAIAVVENVTEASIGTGTAMTTGGAISATATHHGESIVLADGTALGGDTAIGAALAFGFVTNRATATTKRNLTAPTVIFTAAADGSSLVTAKSSAKGEDKGADTDADSQKSKQTGFADDRSNKTNDTSGQSASTDDGMAGGDSVGVAASLALNVSTSTADASVNNVTINSDLTLAASNNMDSKAIADASQADGSTGVGIAVSINVATMEKPRGCRIIGNRQRRRFRLRHNEGGRRLKARLRSEIDVRRFCGRNRRRRFVCAFLCEQRYPRRDRGHRQCRDGLCLAHGGLDQRGDR
ncbi:hypothetical protein QW131_17615 [Roseibium salinum]|nr:hypothetical protein [Roseibium salinum]